MHARVDLEDQIRLQGQIHASQLELTATGHVEPHRVRDRVVPIGRHAIGGDPDVETRRGGRRKDGSTREAGRSDLEHDDEKKDDPGESEAAHGTPVTIILSLFEVTTSLAQRSFRISRTLAASFIWRRLLRKVPPARFREGFSAG